MTTPTELFAIVPVEGKSPADAIVVGPMSEVTSYIGQSIARNEEEQRLAQAKEDAEKTAQHQAEVRAHAAQILSDGLAHLATRLDQLVARRQELADQQRRNAEAAEIARVEAMLNSLPDPDTPAILSDDGDLKATKPPPDTEKYDPEDPEDGEEPDPDNPDNTRAEAVTGLMPPELDKGAPPEAGEYAQTSSPPLKYRDPPSTGMA